MSGATWAIVLSGGRGARYGGEIPKQFLQLGGLPVLVHSLKALLAPAEVAGAVVPCAPELRARLEGEILPGLVTEKPVEVVDGGAERMDSVRAGLAALPEDAGWVLVHDGARPNPSPALLERLLAARAEALAVLPVLTVGDTVKVVDPRGRVLETLDRGPLRLAQTPQLFEVGLLRRAHEAAGDLATDDAQLVERLGEEVLTVAGEPGNLKLTLPGDLGLLEYWMSDVEE